VLSRSTYTLDPVGNRLTSQTTTETATYTYDPLDRLTNVCYTVACVAPGDNFRHYTYDLVGNRVTEVRDTGTTTATYDPADQLTSTTGPGGTVGYTYDLDGRTLTAGTQMYVWAQPDRLASLTQAGTTTTYTSDGDGLRLQASTGAQATKKTNFDWDVNAALPQLLGERDGNNAVVRRYLNGLAPISVTAGSKTAYFAYDGLGSVVNITSSAGATWWTYSYLPFGGVRTATKNNTQAVDNLLRFAGGYLDPTGLYHFGARQYDAGTGRFMSTDPVKPVISDPYVAAYVYGDNNPVRYTDPSGRCPWCIFGAAIGFVAYTTSVATTNWVQGNGVSLQGWNGTDAVISTVAGALSGGLSAAGLTLAEQIIMNSVIGFDSSAASMVASGRRDPGELIVGTFIGAAGPLLPGGKGASGAFRGYVSSTGSNTLQNLINSGSVAYSLASYAGLGQAAK
jgi:RHS repeat-associated protein